MTIRRTFVIVILLAIVFFIYRGISPSGADALLTNIKNIPARLGILTGKQFIDPIVLEEEDLSWAIISWHTVSTGKALVFTSTLVSGWLFPLEALVIPKKKTTTIVESTTTWWHLTIVQDTGAIQSVPVESTPKPVANTPKVATTKSTATPTHGVSSQDIRLLNNLFR